MTYNQVRELLDSCRHRVESAPGEDPPAGYEALEPAQSEVADACWHRGMEQLSTEVLNRIFDMLQAPDKPRELTPSGRRASDWMTEQANARLIAAAPSLYDSAQAVLQWARTPGHHGCNPYSLPFVREAEIALAQAEGRSPENWAQRITSKTPSKV